MTLGEWYGFEDCLAMPINISGVYVVRNTLNGKEYVGKGIDVRRRLLVHSRSTSSTMYIHRAVRKFGIANFKYCVYLLGETSELPELEQLLIAERNTMAPSGYNLTKGGEGTVGRVYSAETRAKIGAKSLGRVISAEGRARANANLLRDCGNRSQGVSLNLKGFQRTFQSNADLAKYLQIDPTLVLHWKRGIRKFPAEKWDNLNGELVKVCKKAATHTLVDVENHLKFTN